MYVFRAALAGCRYRQQKIIGLALVLTGLWASTAARQTWAVTEEQRSRADQLSKEVSAAGQLYAAGSLGQSAAKITEVQQELIGLLKANDPELNRLLKPLYARLLRAHGLLELEGAQLDALPTWESLTTAAKMPPTASPTPPLNTPDTDSPAVSFAQSIAPILTANCQGCHLNSRQASGGLRMDSFAQLLRGGDSGAVIIPNKADQSLLVKRILGEDGDRMPAGGRPPLTAEQIKTVTRWIDAGAAFDGPDVDLDIETVAAQAWADSADHSALFARRQELALARWAKVLPNDQPSTVDGQELFVLGNVPPARLTEVQAEVEAAIGLTKKLLNAPPDQPLLKGGLSIFLLKSRYDYSEFGRMTESRELPTQWLGHWHADPLDVYGVIAADAIASSPRPTNKQAAAVALQIVAGAYLGSFAQVPNWFAEGVARNLVKTTYRRGDERVNDWQQAYPAALQKVDSAKTLMSGKLDEESAGLVGMGITSFMMERTNRRRFDQLLESLRQGQTFEAACTATFAAPEMLVKTWLGK